MERYIVNKAVRMLANVFCLSVILAAIVLGIFVFAVEPAHRPDWPYKIDQQAIEEEALADRIEREAIRWNIDLEELFPDK